MNQFADQTAAPAVSWDSGQQLVHKQGKVPHTNRENKNEISWIPVLFGIPPRDF